MKDKREDMAERWVRTLEGLDRLANELRSVQSEILEVARNPLYAVVIAGKRLKKKVGAFMARKPG